MPFLAAGHWWVSCSASLTPSAAGGLRGCAGDAEFEFGDPGWSADATTTGRGRGARVGRGGGACAAAC